jgi:hypothetical protein
MSEREERGIVAINDAEMVTFDKPEDVISIAQKRVKWMDELVSMSLARLRPGDIVSLEGRPYIVADGCYKIARLFGLKIKYAGIPQKVEAQDKKGAYFYFIHAATVSLPNAMDSVDVIGNCSSRDPFFGKADGVWRPLEDVDVLDIMQKAQTNTDRKGIAKLLGLNNITWDDVAKYSKISQSDCASFSFRKPAKSGPASSSPARSDLGTATPKAQRPDVAPQRSDAAQKPIDTTSPKTNALPDSGAADIDDYVKDEATYRNAAYDAIQTASKAEGKWKGKTPTAIVKEITGKVSLGICNVTDMDKIMEVLK